MAKTRALGADAQLLAAFETVYGTAPDGSGGGVFTQMSFKSYSIGDEKPLGTDPDLGQGRDAQDPFFEAVSVDGDIGVGLDLQAAGFWLKALLGDPDTTDNLDGTYTHVFTAGGDVLPLTLELGHPQLTTPKFERATGVKLGGWQMDLSRTGPARATFSAIAQGMARPVAAADAAPLAYELTRFNNSRGAVKVDAAQLANITGGSMAFSNGLDPVETIRADGLIDGVDEGEATCGGSVDLRFSTDTTITDAIDAETPVALQYGWTIPGADGFNLTIDWPRVFFPRVKNPVEGPGGISATYDWQAAKDPVAGHMMQVTLKNDVDGY